MPFRNPVSFDFVFPTVRGFDYYQWDPASGDPYPLTLAGVGCVYSGWTGLPAITMPNNSGGNTITGRSLPYIGPNNTDGLYKTITMSFLIYIGNGSTGTNLYALDSTTNAQVTVTKGVAAFTFRLSDSVNTVNLVENQWWRITLIYTPNGNMTTTYQQFPSGAVTTLGTVATLAIGSSAPRVQAATNINAGVGNSYIGQILFSWAT